MPQQEQISLLFNRMTAPELQDLLEIYPHLVNARNMFGETCLFRAVNDLHSAPLVRWLLERGATANVADHVGYTPIQYAGSAELFDVLVGAGADPAIRTEKGFTLLMAEVRSRRYAMAMHMLKFPRVHTVINAQDRFGNSALHFACQELDDPAVAPLILLLLKCGADLKLKDARGETPMRLLQRLYPTDPLTLGLPDEISTVEKTDTIVMGVRRVIASTPHAVAPCLQARVVRGRPLPTVEMAPRSRLNHDNKLRAGMALLLGVGCKGLPGELIWAVLEMIMPAWDPLRRKNAVTEPPAEG